MKRLSFIALFLLFSLPVSASFEAISQLGSLEICQCSSQSDIVTVTNTGVYKESFTISHKGSAAAYVTAIPSNFELEPGKSTQIYQYFNTPCDYAGALELVTVISTASGTAKEFTQQINAGICRTFDALTGDYSKTVCPCTPATYNLFVSNTGSSAETYVIGLNKLVEYTALSENPVALKPGQSKTVSATVNAPCEVFGKYDLAFSITAASSDVVAIIPVNLDIEPCYSFDAAFGKAVDPDSSPEKISFTPYSSAYELCNGERTAVPLKIKNGAEVSNVFDAKINGDYASIPLSQLSLEKGQEGIMLVQLTPPLAALGNYSFTVDVTSQRGLITKTYRVDISSEYCYGANLAVGEIEPACAALPFDYPVSIENTGKKSADFLVSVDGPEYIKPADKVKVAAGEIENTTITINPPSDAKGSQKVSINVSIDGKTDTLDYAAFSVDVVPKEKCFPLDISSPSYAVVDYSQNIIPIAVENNGYRTATYKVTVDKDYASIVDEITLKPGQHEVLGLVTEIPSDIAEGTYPIEVKFESSGIEYSKAINLKVSATKGFFGALSNWVRYYFYYIIATAALFVIILIVLMAFWTFKWRKKMKVKELKKAGLYVEEKKEVKKEVGKIAKKETKKKINWKVIGIVAFILIILAAIGVSTYIFEPVQEFFILYGYYVGGGIILLAVILLIVHFNKRLLRFIGKK